MTMVFSVFRTSMAVGSLLFGQNGIESLAESLVDEVMGGNRRGDRKTKTTQTTLNGIVTDVEAVRRNIAEMAADISTDFANLNARTDILLDATRALQEATRRFDAKLDLLMEASFKAGWEQLKLAAGASSESRCERLLERAEGAFVNSYSLLKNERLIMARYGAALAQLQPLQQHLFAILSKNYQQYKVSYEIWKQKK